MYLVTDAHAISRYPTPSRWVATRIIDELETLALEYREAATQHRGRLDEQNLQSRCVLEEVADTCDDIIRLISSEYLTAATTPRPHRSEI